MEAKWFNVYGLIFVAVILIPNVIFAMKCRDGFVNKWNNRLVEALEQIGRFGCFFLMIVNIVPLCGGFWSAAAKTAYCAASAGLTALYLFGWIVFWREDSMAKALLLSILPSLLFLESGVLMRNYPLILAAVIFAPCHILISAKNAARKAGKK